MSPLESVSMTIIFVGAVIGLITALVRQMLVSFKIYTSEDPAKLDASLAFVSFVLGVVLAVGAMLDLPAALGILADAAPWFRQLLSGVVVGLGGTAFALGLIKGGQATVQYVQSKAQKAQAEAVHAESVSKLTLPASSVVDVSAISKIVDQQIRFYMGTVSHTG